ncbi:hypothetical protein D3C86_1554030 [compost metagenome]
MTGPRTAPTMLAGTFRTPRFQLGTTVRPRVLTALKAKSFEIGRPSWMPRFGVPLASTSRMPPARPAIPARACPSVSQPHLPLTSSRPRQGAVASTPIPVPSSKLLAMPISARRLKAFPATELMPMPTGPGPIPTPPKKRFALMRLVLGASTLALGTA